MQLNLATPATSGNYLRGPRVQLGRAIPGQRRIAASAAAAAAAAQVLALHAGETTLELPFSAAHARAVDQATTGLLQTYAAKASAARPQRWDVMELHLALDDMPGGLQYLELLSNPNQYASAFEAKVLVTLAASGGLKLITETRLSSLRADVDAFLMHGATPPYGSTR